jgi:hypothetical protein
VSAPLRAKAAQEPVAVGAAFIAACEAVLAVLVGLDVVSLTAQQVGLVQGAIVAVVGFVAAIVRSRVTPVAP